jgi:hypothetical protein
MGKDCPVSRQSDTFNEINDLAQIGGTTMLHRSVPWIV